MANNQNLPITFYLDESIKMDPSDIRQLKINVGDVRDIPMVYAHSSRDDAVISGTIHREGNNNLCVSPESNWHSRKRVVFSLAFFDENGKAVSEPNKGAVEAVAVMKKYLPEHYSDNRGHDAYEAAKENAGKSGKEATDKTAFIGKCKAVNTPEKDKAAELAELRAISAKLKELKQQYDGNIEMVKSGYMSRDDAIKAFCQYAETVVAAEWTQDGKKAVTAYRSGEQFASDKDAKVFCKVLKKAAKNAELRELKGRGR